MTRTISLVGLLLVAATCGGGGDQPIPPRTTIMWLFDAYPNLGFEKDSCSDLGISQVQVDLTGPEAKTLTDNCSFGQVVFQDLIPGAYTVTVTPLDGAGAPAVKAGVSLQVTAADHDVQATANVPYDDWKTAYTGTFYFHITWGGKDCTTATPVVATQLLTLKQGGVPSTLKTDSGHKVDGTDPEPCRTTDQMVVKLPFGPATIEIIGKDGGGATQYTKQVDTFVGAGLFNPTITYDVPGPPDAMPPDAGMPDAP